MGTHSQGEYFLVERRKNMKEEIRELLDLAEVVTAFSMVLCFGLGSMLWAWAMVAL